MAFDKSRQESIRRMQHAFDKKTRIEPQESIREMRELLQGPFGTPDVKRQHTAGSIYDLSDAERAALRDARARKFLEYVEVVDRSPGVPEKPAGESLAARYREEVGKFENMTDEALVTASLDRGPWSSPIEVALRNRVARNYK